MESLHWRYSMGHVGRWTRAVLTIPCKELVWVGEVVGRHTKTETTSGFWPRAETPEFAIAAAGLEEDWWE